MIGRLTGKLVQRAPGEVLIDVAGVGYRVQIPLSTFYALELQSGPSVSLHIHTHVKEDALDLFGFASVQERSTFVQLIGISGVGPRMALAILSGIGVDELRVAVHARDRERLQRIPGIGRKTAERLLLELKNRWGDGSVDVEPEPVAGPAGVRADAFSALTNLGYSRDAAAKSIDRVLQEADADLAIEDVLRRALSRLVR